MKTCLVSLISDQTIPNILVVTALRPDQLLFISTESMERKKKAESILQCLNLLQMNYHNRYDKLIVPENAMPDFYEKVIAWIKENRKQYEFTVNLTGGTKLMSLAAYEIFRSYGSTMVYIPIPQNLYFPVHRPNEPVPISTRLSVGAYLSAYGVTIANRSSLNKKIQSAHSSKDITYFLFENYKELEPLLQRIGENIRPLKKTQLKKGYDFSFPCEIKNSIEKILIKKLGFNYSKGILSKRINTLDWNYLRGGWLEDRVFLSLETVLPGESSDICIGANCKISGNDNEFDVLFAYENILYVIECKSLNAPGGSDKKEIGGTINDFLYKLGALRQNFGLTPRAILATTSEEVLDNDGNVKSHLISRGKLFNTEIAPLRKISDLEGWFKSRILN